MLSRPEYSVSLNNESTFAQLFRQHFKRFSNECQLTSRYLNWVFKVCQLQQRKIPSLSRNHRDALSVNSCGKWFHIVATQFSARQCWLVSAYIASQYCTSY